MQSHAPVEQVECPANCGKFINLEKSAFSLHLCEECPKVPLTCQDCDETEILRERFKDHQCANYLKGLLNKCKHEIKEREDELVMCKGQLHLCRAQLNKQKELADGYKDVFLRVSKEDQVKLAEQQALAHKEREDAMHEVH